MRVAGRHTDQPCRRGILYEAGLGLKKLGVCQDKAEEGVAGVMKCGLA